MKIINSFFLLLFVCISARGQQECKIEAADDQFYTLISRDAKIEQVGEEFQFTEGPVWDGRENCLLFSDIPANKIYRWDKSGKVSVYRSPSDNSNGLAFDKLGWLIACEHGTRSITVMDKSHHVMPIIKDYKGKRLNSPNDLVIYPTGAIFFTDPPWGLPKADNDPAKELTFNGVFLYNRGELKVIDSTLYRPNGLALSPDMKYLYVGDYQLEDNDPKKVLNFWVRYELNKDLTVKSKTEYLHAPESNDQGNPDGMKIDVKGNFYCTGPGGLLIFNKEGKYLGIIRFPEIPTNCAFGDSDNKTLFITDRKHVYKIRTINAGVRLKLGF
jgi:gluconolactonase